ncbi:DUF2127 domain-containing protein [Patescibacteria group bacterium]|nr:DUF2127 domain-containing protein [Patescibacteria group bacterium]MCG2694787.1 DUF2127 domain-containing protein [Candidatus Parcubacteria bacterium]
MAPIKLFSIKNNDDIYDLFFRFGMMWRIFYGFLRLALGFTLFLFIGTPLSDIFYKIMSYEIVEDPNDFLIQIANPVLHHFSFSVTYFLALYLIFWGVIDILLSINLLKHKLWAFPVSIYLIGIFILYKIYRFSHTLSSVLMFIIIIDLIIIWLINREYKKLKSLT